MRKNVRPAPYLEAFVRANIRKNKPKHRKRTSVWSFVASFSVLLSSLSLVAISGAPAGATVSTAAQPDVAGSNTTVTVGGNPIREGATVAGGTTIGIGTSALLNPGVGSREIRTKYNANTVYQAGTARAPEGWTLYYSTNNGSTWSTTEPSPASGVTDIKATASSVAAGVIDGYSQEYSTETSASIPSSTFSASTGGDGWGVAFYDNYVFNIFHHNDASATLDCHLRTTGARCPGYTKVLTAVENGVTVNYRAAGKSDIEVDAASGNIFSFTAPTAGADLKKPGILCIDVRSTPTTCGFTALQDGAEVSSYQDFSTLTRVGNRIFGVIKNSTSAKPALLCFEVSTRTRCAGSPIQLDTATPSDPRIRADGDRVFTRTGSKIGCYMASTLSVCSGSWPVTTTTANANSDLYLHSDSLGVTDGICIANGCWNYSGVSQTYTNALTMGGGNSVWYEGVTVLGRYYVSNSSTMKCWDFSTNAICSGFTSPTFSLLYQIVPDPENPACLWTNADNGYLRNMDAYTGALGCTANPVITLQPSQFAPRYACSTAQGIDLWGNLKISQLVGGGSASSIKLTVRDPNGNPVSGYSDRTITLNNNLDLSAMNVALSGSRPTFSFAFSGITGSITSATIALEYKGKGPELCSTAVLASPMQATAVSIDSNSVDAVGLTNLYESQRNFNIGNATVNSNLYLTVPSAPVNLTGTGLNSNATLTFEPPADNGGLDLGDYFYSLDGGTTFNAVTNLADNGDGTYSVAISGLTPGQTYSIKVAATNSLGRGALASLSLTAQVVDFASIPDTYQNAGPIYLQTQNSDGLPYTYIASPSNVCTVASNVVTLLIPGTCNLTQNQSGDATHIATTANTSFQILTNPVVVVAPDAPINLAATPSSTQVSLTWQAPVNNGNGAITDYVVQYKVGSSWVPLVDGTSTNTFAIVTGLTNGTTYSFKVAAVNSAGQGAYSTSVDSVPATVPGAVTSLSANKSGTSATLTWTAPSSTGGSAITDYRVQFKLSSEPTWSTFTDPVTATTGATVTGLNSSATYDFQVTAKNLPGFGAPVSTVTLNATGQAAAIGLTWAANTDGVVISNHIVEYRLLGDTNWLQVDTGSTTRSATVSSLINGSSYEVRVARITGTGGSAVVSSYTSTVIGIPVTTPAAPTVFAAAGAAQVELSWTAPASNGADIFDYVVKYRLVGASSWTTWSDGVSTSTSAVILGLTNGSDYEFQVAAQNSVGVGTYSTTVTSKPRTTPGAISGLSLSVTGVTMTLSWNAPTDNGGAPISDYVIEYKLLGDTSWTPLTRSTSTTRSGSISGLNPNTRYSVRVAAVNEAGTGSFGPAGSELTGTAPSPSPSASPSPSVSASVSPSPSPSVSAEPLSAEPQKPVLQSKFKQVIKHKEREKVELKFIKIDDVKSVKVDGKEIEFKVVEGTVTFVDPGISLGTKDVVVEGSWGSLTLTQVIEVVKSTALTTTPVFETFRISGFAPGMAQLTKSMMTKIKSFVKSMTSPIKLTCQGSTSGPTVLKVDPQLAKNRAANVCKYIKSLNSKMDIKTTALNTVWMSPLARNVTLKYSK